MRRPRLNEIDIASGIAIILVVSGHLSDYDPSWYGQYKISLYKFHMAFFMFLSGFLLSYTRDNFDGVEKYMFFLKSKALKFIIPYLFMSFLFLAVKIILGDLVSKNEILKMILNVFVAPTSGASIFLWYIYVLLLYYILFPLLYTFKVIKNNLYILIFIGFLFQIFSTSIGILELDQFCSYFLYFAIGYHLLTHYGKIKIQLVKMEWMFYSCFIVLLSFDLYNNSIPEIVLSLFSIPTLLAISIKINNSRLIEIIGKNTFSIYIWNSVFLFGSKTFIRVLDPAYKEHFYFYLPFLILIGIFFPLILRAISRKLNVAFLKFIIP